MRFGIIAENPLEAIGLASGMVPTPMLEPYGAAFGRTLMVATKLGVFEALVEGPMTASAVADRCEIDGRATEKLMNLARSLVMVVSLLSGCGLLPEQAPVAPDFGVGRPTPIELPDGTVIVEVAWHNEADEDYIVTIADGGNLVTYANVDRCGSNNLITGVTGPWVVGLGRAVGREEVTRPEPTIFDSEEIEAGDPRILLLIERNGHLSIEPLVGEAPFDPPNDC